MGLAGEGAHTMPADRASEDQAWLDLVGRTGEAHNPSPVYRLRLNGPIPQGLIALPKDHRAVHPGRGREIMDGVWRFGALTVETPPDRAPWGPAFPSLHFADRIHRFHWLRDVAAQGPAGEERARSLAISWIEAFGKWDAFAWRPAVVADRLVNLLSAGPWLFNGIESETRANLLDSMARQTRHLSASAGEESDPAGRFRCAVALALAGASLAELRPSLDQGLTLLEAECGTQILADGGHASRSPETLANAMLDIQAVEDLLLRIGVNAPAFLTRLQPRMASMLSFFSTQDGGLLAAHGGGEGSGGLAAAAMAPHGGLVSKFSFARLTAYQRVQADELTLYFDTGAGPEKTQGGRAHAGALSICVDDGTDRLITSCGAHSDLEPALREAGRQTAAHSVLSLNGEDSALWIFDPSTGLRFPEGPAAISARRLEENEQYLLEGQHGGWRVRHGLIYRRRLYIAKNGARITGEDSLSRPMSETTPASATSIPYALRFHLHPGVQIAPGPDDRTVFLGLAARQRVWRFRSESLLSIENSRYWGAGAAVKTQQLVVRGEADAKADGSQPPNRVRWALSRIEPGV
ncbi:MAG: heparinase II/III family protein [Alphaproteobacteria bacterium]|nr:heparinase II/III family protein [Alphaproteobacteria bacterium]